MATIKSCTDLSQSKRLAEFLSSDSADFFWIIGRLHTDGPRYERIWPRNEVSEPENHWPCWSLATLFSLLPHSARIERGSATELYRVVLPVEMRASDWYVSPIDAVYEMIIKLHEQKKI